MLRSLWFATAAVAFSVPALGTVTVDIGVTTSGGNVANSLKVTTTDYGWAGAQLYIRVFSPGLGGSVINLDPGSGGVDGAPTQAQIDANPALLFDTFYGVVGQQAMGVGGAPELGGTNQLELGPTQISASWLAPYGLHAPSNQLSIANIVLDDNTFGTWSLKIAEPYQPTYKFVQGLITGGEISLFLDGDLNLDGFVGIEDMNIVLSHWNEEPASDPAADPSGDGFVGIEDMSIVLGKWNAGRLDEPWTEGVDPDTNGDGFVGIGELDIILSNWHQNVTPGDVLSGDLTGDGFVGFDDIVIVQEFWNSGTPPATALPEPAGLALLSLGSLGMLRRHRA